MSSVNARVPPLRLLAVDNPSDGEVPVYQASSGRFEWVAQSGGGGGTVTSITLVADSGTGTALTTSGTFTFTGATGISTSVSGTTVTITGPDLTPYVDGSGASTQVAYWSDTDTITGSPNLTFDGTNLSVGGYIKSGGVYDTTGATDLTLKTNGGLSSGQLDLKAGADGNLIFTPNGAGLLQIEGSTNPGSVKLMCEVGTHGVTIQSPAHSADATYTFKMPTSMGTDGQVLTTDGSSQTSWTTISGGSGTVTSIATSAPITGGTITTTGTIGISQAGASSEGFLSISDWNTFNDKQNAITLTTTGTSGASTLVGSTLNIPQYSGGSLTFPIEADSGSASAPSYSFSADTDTGFFQATADTLSISNSGSETFRFGSSGELLVGGTASGTSGQVLTSGGTGSAVSWSTVSGGSSYNQARNPNGAIYTGQDINILTRGVGMTNVGPLSNSVSTRSNYRQLMTRQFISPETGNVSAFYAYCDTASSDTDIELAIYSDNGGKPYQLLGKGTIDCSSTGAKSQTSLSATISLTEGVQYWYSWVTTNSTGSPTLRAEDQNTGQFTTGQTSSISTTDKSMYLIDISAGAENTSPSEITASNLYPGGNTGGACRMGIKF